MQLDAKIPSGPIAEKWDKHRFHLKLVNPANKRKYKIIVVARLAGVLLLPLWVNWATMSIALLSRLTTPHTPSPRKVGSTLRKTIKTMAIAFIGFFTTRSKGAITGPGVNVHRLAQVSVNIIDQCVVQGVPFAREYGGLLANRSFGGAQVSRTFMPVGKLANSCFGCLQCLEPQL